jgi:hypothetical protein
MRARPRAREKLLGNVDMSWGLALLLIQLLSGVFPRIPLESLWLLNDTFGSCEPFQLPQLGSFTEATEQGLVAQNLQFLAHNDFAKSSTLYTMESPRVQIIQASILCSSRAIVRNRFSTVTIRVQYTCTGVACGQEPSDVREREYTHLFAFACTVSGNEYATLDNFMKHPHVNRSDDNHVHTFNRECSFCTVDPTIQDGQGRIFHGDIGCLGMLCRVVGLMGTSIISSVSL